MPALPPRILDITDPRQLERVTVNDVLREVYENRVDFDDEDRRGTIVSAKVHKAEDDVREALTNDAIAAQAYAIRAQFDPHTRERRDLSIKHPLIKDIDGIEVLLRFIEYRKRKSPGAYLQAAQHNPELVHELDLRMLDESIKIGKVINHIRARLNLPLIPISVNCSRFSVHTPEFGQAVVDKLRDADFPPQLCMIEILEKVALTEELTSDQIEQFRIMREAGIQFALDDFDRRTNKPRALPKSGTGEDPIFAALSKAEIDPVEVMKIDGKVTSRVLDNAGEAQARAYIEIAKRKGIKAITWEVGKIKGDGHQAWADKLEELKVSTGFKGEFFYEGIYNGVHGPEDGVPTIEIETLMG